MAARRAGIYIVCAVVMFVILLMDASRAGIYIIVLLLMADSRAGIYLLHASYDGC